MSLMLYVISFHRSLSSSLANWLHYAGLDMGHYLMPPAISNPEGHYEDMPLVGLHDRLMRLNGADWRFHDESELEPAVRLGLLERYVQRRSATASGPWGAKDPRACLFVPAWRKVLGEQGRYLVLLRHWSGSVQSLYRRHSEALAVGEGSDELHTSFWQQPEQAARMWLAYHRRVLPLLEENPEQCVVVTQQALLGGLPIIEKINECFGLALDTSTPSPIRHSLSHDRIEEGVRERLPAALVEELEAMWQRLLASADHHAESEEPQWVNGRDEAQQTTQVLLKLADAQPASEETVTPCLSPGSLQEQLQLLAENTALPLDVAQWRERIEQEARFMPECWEFLARARLNRGDALGAEQELARVLLCGKSQPYLFLLLGICREAELDYEGAEHFYRQAIARNDANATFHVRLANLWLAQGRHDQAENHLRQTLERHPGKPPLVHALANCLDQQGRTEAAMELLELATDELSGSPALLTRQMASLRHKLAPKCADDWRHEHAYAAASRFEVQQAAIIAVASVADPAARRDLAQRIANTWQRLGVPMPSIPE